MNYAQTKERATKKIQKLQRTKREQITKPHNQNQVVTNLSHYSKLQAKYQITKQRESLFFSHTLSKFTAAALYLYRRLESASIQNQKRLNFFSTHKRRITLIPYRIQNQMVDKTSNRA